MAAPSLVLFRRDLRVADHPALAAAMDAGPTVAVYVLDDCADGRPLGGAARWWLHHALTRLELDLGRLGVPLILRRGAQNAVIPALAREVQAGGLYWSRRHTPWGVAADTDLKAWANETGITAHSYAGSYLVEPWAVQTKQGQPFKVFTPFYKAMQAAGEPSLPLPEPEPQEPLLLSVESDTLADWALLPTQPDWASGLRQTWQFTAGERAAHFLDTAVNA
jgi:deoxyribodipyrimidine photo-lyase